MRRLVKSIGSKAKRPTDRSRAIDPTGMKAADLRALAAQRRREIQDASLDLARLETQIAQAECGRVRGRAEFLQKKLHRAVYYNPESGCALADDLQVFHDCTVSDIAVRQRNLSQSADEAPFPLEIEVYRFDGSFLSIVHSLPDDAVEGASDQDIYELSFAITSENDCEVYLRLNVRHGPNESQLTRSCRPAPGRQNQSFDLAEAELSHRPVERIWLDVIFSDPEMNRIEINDLVVRRRARAQV